MVTLVDVELFAQTLLGKSSGAATVLLVPFLIALPIGALLGGWGARWRGERLVACGGMVIATIGYLLISQWPVDVLRPGISGFFRCSPPTWPSPEWVSA